MESLTLSTQRFRLSDIEIYLWLINFVGIAPIFIWKSGNLNLTDPVWTPYLNYGVAFVILIYVITLSIDLSKKYKKFPFFFNVSAGVGVLSILFAFLGLTNEVYHRLGIFFLFLSIFIMAPTVHPKVIIKDVNLRKNERGFGSLLVLGDVGDETDLTVPLDLGLTHNNSLRFLFGDVYSKKQSTFASQNIPFFIMTYLTIWVPTGTNFPKMIMFVSLYLSAYFLSLVIRFYVAKQHNFKLVAIEVQQHLKLNCKTERQLNTLNKGILTSFYFALVLFSLVIFLPVQTNNFPKPFQLENFDWSVFWVIPIVVLIIFIHRYFWNRFVWKGFEKIDVKRKSIKSKKKKR